MAYVDKEQQREYQRQWIAKKRARHIKAFDGKCSCCGSRKDLEFDHRNPRFKISHRIWSWSEARIEKELSKCQLLCRECHLEKTKAEHARKRKHGTNAMYQKWGCRCVKCKAAHAEVNARYK